MKWPMIAGTYSQSVRIWHAQAWAGNPDLHPHDLVISFGWKHEINPSAGHTWSVYETRDKVEQICALVHEKNLNDLLPNQPTIETLACWLLVRTPAFYSHIEIAAYGGYQIRLERKDVSDVWTRHYLGSEAPQGLTA